MSPERHIPDEQLPLWMKQARRSVDWGALLVILLALLVARPIITNPNLPDTNQTLAHVWHAETTAHMLDNGELYPRWSPYALRGYGAPIPNFHPPAVSVLSGLLDVVFLANTITAVRLLMVLSYISGGMALYVLVTQRSHARAGIISAMAYLYSPYMGLTLPHQLGDVTTLLAMALLPVFLWSINRILSRNQPADVLYVTLSGALLLLTEPRYFGAGLLFAAGLAGYMLYRDTPRRRLFSATMGILCALGLTAFYWLPALVEQAHINWYPQNAIAPPLTVDLSDLLTWPLALDAGALVHPPQWTTGAVLPLTCLLSGLVLWRMRRLKLQAVFGGIALLLIPLVLLLPSQTWLFGLLILCLSIASSGFMMLLDERPHWIQAAGLTVSVAGLLLLSLPMLITSAPTSRITDTSFEAQLAYEDEGYGLAILPAQNAVPAPVDPATLSGTTSLTDRLNTLSSPNAQITPQDEHLLTYRYTIRIGQPTRAVFSQMYFPGWQATLNNDELIPVSRLSNGLTGLDLPANASGTLVIRRVATQPQILSWLLSGLALLVALSVFYIRWRQRTMDYDPGAVLHQSSVAALLFVILPGTGFMLMNLDSLQPEPDYRRATAITLDAPTRFGPVLLAYDAPARAQPGGELDIMLYWQTEFSLPLDYIISVRLHDATDREIVSVTQVPGFVPVSRWLPGYYVPDRYQLPLPSDLPEGTYRLSVQVGNCQPTCLVGGTMPFELPDPDSGETVQQNRLTLPQPVQIEN